MRFFIYLGHLERYDIVERRVLLYGVDVPLKIFIALFGMFARKTTSGLYNFHDIIIIVVLFFI
jgi:hypothetical protein